MKLMKSLFYYHEKEMLKKGKLCEKFSKRKLERSWQDSIVIKFEVPESKLGLLTTNNIMLSRNKVVSSYCVLKIIQQLKALNF